MTSLCASVVDTTRTRHRTRTLTLNLSIGDILLTWINAVLGIGICFYFKIRWYVVHKHQIMYIKIIQEDEEYSDSESLTDHCWDSLDNSHEHNPVNGWSKSELRCALSHDPYLATGVTGILRGYPVVESGMIFEQSQLLYFNRDSWQRGIECLMIGSGLSFLTFKMAKPRTWP